jgi:RNA polymerase sigma-70 factor (ECF subfamily)
VRPGRTPEQWLLDGSLDTEIREALDALPEEYREVVWLAVVEDLSYKEIAAVLSIPIGTVMSRLHRGRRLLQAALVEYGRRRGLLPGARAGGGEALRQRAEPAGPEPVRDAAVPRPIDPDQARGGVES